MNRRNFIKSAGALTALPSVLAASTEPDTIAPTKPEQSGMYYIRCYSWSYKKSTEPIPQKNYHGKHSDLWTDPEPRFSNIDSAVKFIEDHKNIWDLNKVNVTYDITFYSDNENDNCVYSVGRFNYNTAGVYQWIDYPPHHRHDYDSF